MTGLGGRAPITALAALLTVCLSSGACRAATETVVYAFKGGNDGANPQAGLIDVGSTLYGTTLNGGTSDLGAVFQVTTAGVEKVLHSFQGNPNDGAYPYGGLLNVAGTFYGTTCNGGSVTSGTVFKVTKAGNESLLYSFGAVGNAEDGACPTAGLIKKGQIFYGTTQNGGQVDDGTVFQLTLAGVETVLHSFTGYPVDGGGPSDGVIQVGKDLYGTTGDGGNESGSEGIVFRVTKGGTETLLHGFGNGSDGAYPSSGLIEIGGVLYGTTTEGGASNDGTVYKITTSGAEAIVYSFKGGTADGQWPGGGLIALGNELYGTTEFGGTSGLGTIFKLTPAGAEQVIYSFAGHGDGEFPTAALVNVGGTLYGTTTKGGTGGFGIVFAVAP